MIDGSDKRWIINEVRRQIQSILTGGTAGTSATATQDIDNLMPGHPTVQARPVVSPFGFSSRAPRGKALFTAQQGEHPGNKVVLGVVDKEAPGVDEGEAVAYSVGGYRVFIRNDRLTIGKGDTVETMVVGETLKTVLIALITAINAHTHEYIAPLVPAPTNPVPTGPPDNAADFTQIQTENLDNDKILAKDGGRFT